MFGGLVDYGALVRAVGAGTFLAGPDEGVRVGDGGAGEVVDCGMRAVGRGVGVAGVDG